MKISRFLSVFSVVAVSLMSVISASGGGRKMIFNDGWKFSLTSDSVAPARVDYDDKGWRVLNLPHDWSVEHPFSVDAPAGNDGAYLPAGAGWYRRVLNVGPSVLGKKLQLYFEGAYMKSDVYVNGHRAGGNQYGYSSFFVDITPYIHEGKNTIAVRVDNSMQKNCRWYSGSGLYRNVWLIETDKCHVANWGVRISTPDLNTALVKTTLVNESDEKRDMTVSVSIAGLIQEKELSLAPGECRTIDQTFEIRNAKPWSPESPNLYTATVAVEENGKTIDEETTRFGFRTVDWSADKGLLINGRPTVLNGGCVHHDNGILGAAAFDRAERHRVEQLKEAGFNAVRTSHNIPSEKFLDACDEVGLLVIDEPFDGWREKKNDHDYHELFDRDWRKDLDVMLMRDFNHPSVFCWSIGNEVIERDKIEVVTTARKLVARCHEIDPYRPVTSALACWGMDWTTYDPLAEAHDIVGYNYMIHESAKDHARDPHRVMMQTESYPADAWRNYRKVADNPYIIGDFVWTAIDYLGESGIGRWYYDGDVEGEHFHRPLYPWHAAYCGDIDLTGLRKPISHYRSMLWNTDGESLYIAVREPDGYKGKVRTTMWGTWPTFASWNWPGHEGKDIEVEVYSHYPTVRLYLDDQLIGEQPVKEMKATFKLPYKEGRLTAQGVSEGKVCEEKTLSTAGEVTGMRLSPDRAVLSADTGDLSYIVIEFIDKDGNVNPVADNKIEVKVSGDAVLQALGNADIKDEDPYFDNTHKAWHGRAVAVVRSTGKKGSATVSVSSPGLKSKAVKLKFYD